MIEKPQLRVMKPMTLIGSKNKNNGKVYTNTIPHWKFKHFSDVHLLWTRTMLCLLQKRSQN